MILSPTLYSVYTSDMPTRNYTLVATYADDTAIIAQAKTPGEAAAAVQHHLLALESWLRKWRIKINIEKTVQITFTLHRRPTRPIYMNGRQIPQSRIVRYLGLKLDSRLTWSDHIKTKRQVLNHRLKTLYRLLCPRSPLSLRLKLLLYSLCCGPSGLLGFNSLVPQKKIKFERVAAVPI